MWGQISGVEQQQGSLPNVALTNVSNGFVIITTNATGQLVTISGNTCPASMLSNVVDGVISTGIEFPVNRSSLSCQFTITDDQGTGKSVTVNYTNT